MLCIGWKDWSCPKLLTIDEQNKRHQSGFQEDSWPPPLDNGASIFVGGCHRLFYAIYRAITAWKTQRLSPFLIFMTKSNPSLQLSHCSLGLTSSWVVISISFCHQGNHCLHFGNPSTHISSFAFGLQNVSFHLPSHRKRVLHVPHGLFFQGSAIGEHSFPFCTHMGGPQIIWEWFNSVLACWNPLGFNYSATQKLPTCARTSGQSSSRSCFWH